jgi:hypothetical protein
VADKKVYKVGDLVQVNISRNHNFVGTIKEIQRVESYNHFADVDESYDKYWFLNDGWETWAYDYQISDASSWPFYVFFVAPVSLLVCLFIYCVYLKIVG